jgi:homoserine kinase
VTTLHACVRVPATTANVGPGFDAFGAALSRWLSARAVPRSAQEERVVTTGDGAGEIATGDDNLVWRCLVRFCEEHDVAVPDVALQVHNDVPLERGLGSSSAAIVAGLTLGRVLSGATVGDLDVVRLANGIEGHPDNVAPAVLGGFVACVTDDAGDLVVRRAQPPARLRPVVLVPSSRQRTTEARGVLPASLDRGDVAHQAARAGHVVGALVGAWPIAPGAAGDVLHEPARLDVMGPTGEVVRELRSREVHAWLSGAGPTAAAAVGGADERQLAACREVGERHGFDVAVLRWDLGGTIACDEGNCAVAARGTCTHWPSREV